MAASGGIGPNADHSFAAADLPVLFEQLIIQLQDVPAPPLRYRPQEGEPGLVSDQRVRLVVGFSAPERPPGSRRQRSIPRTDWPITTSLTLPGPRWRALSPGSSRRVSSVRAAASSARSCCRELAASRSCWRSAATSPRTSSPRPWCWTTPTVCPRATSPRSPSPPTPSHSSSWRSRAPRSRGSRRRSASRPSRSSAGPMRRRLPRVRRLAATVTSSTMSGC